MNDIEQQDNCERVIASVDGVTVELIFKPEPVDGLRPEEMQLLQAYIGEILQEIEHEEKLIIEAEKKAAEEITARKGSKEGV